MSRETIRQASIKLFSSKGYEGTSVKDIAEELSITPPALYSHYKSKEELYLDALSSCLGRLSCIVKEAVFSAKSQCVSDVLYNICSSYLNFYINDSTESLFLLRSMMFPPSDILEKSNSLTKAYFKEIREITSVLFSAALRKNEIVNFSSDEHTYHFFKVINSFIFEITALNIKVTPEVFEKTWTRYWNSIVAPISSTSEFTI